ncbi:MAG: chaperonin GroEL [Candidatus Saccharimonadaceae bacterium]
MAQRVFFGDDARRRLLLGLNILADSMEIAYGPKGGNAAIGHAYYEPDITHDGVTIANAIELEDGNEFELGQRVGAEIAKRGANNLNILTADGTTTVVVLTRAITIEAHRLIAAGHNYQEVRRGIEDAGAQILALLEDMGEKITPDSIRVEQVATISASGDKEIGKLLAEIIKKIGNDSAITVETHQGKNLDHEVTEGLAFDYGMVSPAFINNEAKREAQTGQAAIIIYNDHIGDSDEVIPLINKILPTGTKDIILFAASMEKEVIRTFTDYKVNGHFNPVIVKAPATDEARNTLFADIALITGATVLSDTKNADSSDVFTLENANLAQVGRVQSAIIGQEKSQLIDGSGNKKAIDARIKDIKAVDYQDEYTRDIGNRRAAALNGKVAIIRVGGVTDSEIGERKDRVDDAVGTVQAALKEGVVAGGGITLVHLAQQIKYPQGISDAHRAGITALKNALEYPFLKIMKNAGLRSESLLDQVIEENLMHKTPTRGIDVMGGKGLLNMFDAGIIDAKLVTKEVIKNAVSLAAVNATTNLLVVDIPVKSIANNA